MTVFGLTGGIACGKSSVAEIFRNSGVPMVDADKVARSLVYPGSPVLQKTVKHFGQDILLEDGNLNRRKLAKLVFGDQKKMDLLNNINRKPIRAAINTALKETELTARLIGYDCALIIEMGQRKKYRPLVVVATSDEIQLHRLMARNLLTAAEAKKRIQMQMSTTDKLQYADYVIWNNGEEAELLSRTMEVVYRLLINVPS